MIKRALVTGSAGFVGRHMTKYLNDLGWLVDCVDIAHSPGGEEAVEYFRYAEHRVYDLVVHCAYHVGGRAAIDGINLNLASNLVLDSEMFHWAVRTKQRAVLYFSSSAAYPKEYQSELEYPLLSHYGWNLTEDYIDLDAAKEPDSDYGWAKLTGERLGAAAANNGLRVHTVRPFSGYGEDQSLDYPFPSIIRRARKGDLTVWGPPGQTRDWIHISDVVRGAYAVYDHDERRAVNLCTGVGTEMGELMVMCRQKLGEEDADVSYLTDKPTGVLYRVGDPQRMLEHYTPTVTIEEGISRAIEGG